MIKSGKIIYKKALVTAMTNKEFVRLSVSLYMVMVTRYKVGILHFVSPWGLSFCTCTPSQNSRATVWSLSNIFSFSDSLTV